MAQKTTKKKSNKKTKSVSGSTTKKTPAKISQNPANDWDSSLYKELLWILLSIFCVYLFLSNLSLGGKLGDLLRQLQFGLFGTMAYAFPFLLITLCIAVYLGDGEENPLPMGKIVIGSVFFLFVCGFVGLIGGQGQELGTSLGEMYKNGGEGMNGGVLGGIICVNLVSLLGTIGSFLIIMVCILVSGVLLLGRRILIAMYHRRQKLRKKAHARRVRAREEQRLRQEELELEEEEEELRRREEELEFRRRQEHLEARRTELRARSLAFGEATKLEPEKDSEENSDADTDVKDGTPAPEAKSEEKRSVRIPIHGEEEDEIFDSRSIKTRMTLAEQKELDRPKAGPIRIVGMDDDDDYVEDVYSIEKHSEPEVEEVIETSQTSHENVAEEPEVIEPEEIFPEEDSEDDVTDLLDTSGWLNPEASEIPIRQSSYEQNENRGRHPAAEEFSSEESMAGYDDFQDAPTPEEVLSQTSLGGKSTPKKPMMTTSPATGAAGTGSIWREGPKQEGNAGARFSDLTVKPKEEPVIQKEYVFPSMELLREPSRKGGMSKEQLNQTAEKLQQTLRNFGVGVTVTEISCGPSVTRYELQPDQGVKVSRIVGLADDIKLNLAAADIRIEAPIPGKAAIGIEVPNEVKQMVTLRELIDSDEFRRNASKISFGVGKDIAGKVITADLARMPHLLIAGATGSGKSVCINSIIVSILYKAHPKDVQLIMIDPKVVELSIYNNIPHLMIPVVTDPKKAAQALEWAVREMTDRYRKFADTGSRDIKSYNRKAEAANDPDMPKMPQIVVIVDELADLMMVAANEVEEAICRLAQLARAAGIHLVLATQRPSVDVITGLIKANVPSRIAFSVSSTTDSRTIIDMGGAEKLLGNGDMMFYPAGYPKPVRVQGAFVSDDEVASVVEFLIRQDYKTTGNPQAIEAQMSQGKDAGTVGSGSYDELFEKAGRYIIEKEKASIGNLQRMFRIGFNRAARIMDQLADYGVVGPEEGTKARQILMTMEEFDELMNNM